MANQDSFINEVTEEVRRDRLFALFRRYGWIAALLVIVLVGGASYFEWQKAKSRAEAEATGDALIAALREVTPEARSEALMAVDDTGAAGNRAVLGLLKSAAAAEIGDQDAANAALDAVISDTEIPQVYRDLATLKQVMIGTGAMDPADRIARLQPLLQAGNPFRLLAVEQRAFAEIEQGEPDAAIETLQSILDDADVTEDLRRRATQLIVALGGTLEQG